MAAGKVGVGHSELNRIVGIWLEFQPRVEVGVGNATEDVIAIRIGSGLANHGGSVAVKKSKGYVGDARLVGVLDAVGISVDPKAITDFDGGSVAQRLNVTKTRLLSKSAWLQGS